MPIGSHCLYRKLCATFIHTYTHMHRHEARPLPSLQIFTQLTISAHHILAINKAIYHNITSFNASSIQFSVYEFLFFQLLSLPLPLCVFLPLNLITLTKHFPCVLLYADLTVEEMFCLILKCEEICGQSAKSHYSPPCSAVLHEANPRRRGEKGGERDRQRKKMLIRSQTDE